MNMLLERLDQVDFLKSYIKDLVTSWCIDDVKGKSIATEVYASASYILSQVVLDYPNIPLPFIHPTLAGGIHAEWIIKNNWSVEAIFEADGKYLSLLANNIHTDQDRNYAIRLDKPINTISRFLGPWLNSF